MLYIIRVAFEYSYEVVAKDMAGNEGVANADNFKQPTNIVYDNVRPEIVADATYYFNVVSKEGTITYTVRGAVFDAGLFR